MRKALILLGILCALTLGIVLAHQGRGGGVEVQAEPLGRHSIRSSILASGKITFNEKASLTAEIIGIVKAVHVNEGDIVRKGKLVLEIRNNEYVAAVEQSNASVMVQEAAIERAKLNVERMRQQYDRNTRLLEAKLIARDAFDQFKLNYDVAEVDLRASFAALAQSRAQAAQAEQLLGKTHIYAPLDGVVTSVDIKEGETAIPSVGGIPGSTLMTIANPDSIYTEVNVDEADIGNIKPGDEAEVVAVAYPNTPIKGRLDSMATSAKVAEGRQGLSFAVKIRLAQNGRIALRPGMSCRAEIYTHSLSDVVAAPLQSIVTEEDRRANRTDHYVFITRDNVAQKVAVTVGISDDSYQEIRTGARAGDMIITGPDKALQNLKHGDTVKIRKEPAMTAAALR
jgi:HlyD family secretion protein